MDRIAALVEEKMAGKTQRVTAEGKGESQPVTGEDCVKASTHLAFVDEATGRVQRLTHVA